jgi:hypothetical protein
MIMQKVKPRNPKLIREFRKESDCCERCNSRFSLEVAHITSKGAGGPDIRENLLKLCGPASMGMGCHGAAHKGKISQEELYELVGRREGITAAECRIRTRRAMGYAVRS